MSLVLLNIILIFRFHFKKLVEGLNLVTNMSIWPKEKAKNENDQVLETTDFTENIREITDDSFAVVLGGVYAQPFFKEFIFFAICLYFALMQAF